MECNYYICSCFYINHCRSIYSGYTYKTALVCGEVAIVYHLAVSTFKPEEYKNWETDINSKERKGKALKIKIHMSASNSKICKTGWQ